MESLSKMMSYIKLEMTGSTKKYLVSAKQGDKATRYVVAKLMNNGVEYTIPVDAKAVINIKKPDGKHVYNTCTHSGSEVMIELTNQILAAPGIACCDVEIRTSDGSQVITSASFEIEIEKSMRNDKAIESSNEFTELEKLLGNSSQLSKKVDEIINGTQTVGNAEKLDGLDSTEFYRLGAVEPLSEGADLDTFLTPGQWGTDTDTIAQTILNKPDWVTSKFKVIVEYALRGASSNYIRQTIIMGNNTGSVARVSVNSVFRDWIKNPTQSEVTEIGNNTAENLFDTELRFGRTTIGVTSSVNEVGNGVLNGTVTSAGAILVSTSDGYIDVSDLEVGEVITLSGKILSGSYTNATTSIASAYVDTRTSDGTNIKASYTPSPFIYLNGEKDVIYNKKFIMTQEAKDAGICYLYPQIWTYTGDTFDNLELQIMIEPGSVAHPYKPSNLSRNIMRKDIDSIINATKIKNTTELTDIKNVLDTHSITEKYVAWRNGRVLTTETVEEWAVTDLIEVKIGDVLYWANGLEDNSSSVPAIVMYDKSGGFVNALFSNDRYTSGSAEITDKTVKYIRYNFVESSVMSYDKQYLYIKTSKIGYNLPLVGTTYAAIGDSITWYDGHKYIDIYTTISGVYCKGYQSYVRDLLGCDLINYGYSAKDSSYMLEQVQNIDFSEVDICSIMTGVNDGGASMSVETYKQNLRDMIDKIQGDNPLCRLFLLSNTFGCYTKGHGFWNPFIDDRYVNAMKEVALEYNIPFYDNYHSNGINKKNYTQYLVDEITTVDYLVHPNVKGYEIIGKQIARFMYSKLV